MAKRVKRVRIHADRYAKIKLLEDTENRSHHAIIFPKSERENDNESLGARFMLPEFLTWTPTGHGSISNWDLIPWGEELALLVPRSLWLWFIPGFILSKDDKKDLFYLTPAL